MFRIFLLIVIIASAVGNGIVKHVMKDDEPWPNGPVPKFTEYLQCDYRHNVPGDHQWTYAYNIHCTKKEGEPEFILSIDYDNNVFDNFVVISCDPKDVANSVFPPKQKESYTASEADEKGRHVISYIKYKTAEGKCFARKYQYVNRVATAAKRFTPEEIDCPGKEGWLKYGEVAQFTGCRVPKLPLSNIVKAWFPSGGSLEENALKEEKLLDCTFDQYSQLSALYVLRFPDQWINPSWGFAGQWRQCKWPMSIREMAQKGSQ